MLISVLLKVKKYIKELFRIYTYLNLEMAEVELSDNLTELLNASGYCGTALSSEAVETINYYRYL